MKAIADAENPVPFRQPFLALKVRNSKWLIDVDSQIHLYFDFWDEKGKSSDKLNNLINLLASRGIEVTGYGWYVGSAGPTHILRHGFLFERMDEVFEKEAKPKVLFDFDEPKYMKYYI